MEQGLKPSETTSFFAPSRIEHYRLVPLKLALKQLELKLSQVSACLVVAVRWFVVVVVIVVFVSVSVGFGFGVGVVTSMSY